MIDGFFRLVPIPEEFFQEDERCPFTRCVSCDREFDENSMYVVEKAFQMRRAYGSRDTVFEYALCMDCFDELSESFSTKSQQAMNDYFNSRVDFADRSESLASESPDDVTPWLSSCLVSGKLVGELDGYQIAGVFIGSQMVLSHVPCLLSSEVVAELAEVISKQTIDILGGFASEVLPQPPGFEKDLPVPVLVL